MCLPANRAVDKTVEGKEVFVQMQGVFRQHFHIATVLGKSGIRVVSQAQYMFSRQDKTAVEAWTDIYARVIPGKTG